MVLLETLETKRRFHDLKFASLPGATEDEPEREVLLVSTEEGKIDCYTLEILVMDEEDVKAEKERLAAESKKDDVDEQEDEDEEDEEASKTVAIVEKIATFVGHTNRWV